MEGFRKEELRRACTVIETALAKAAAEAGPCDMARYHEWRARRDRAESVMMAGLTDVLGARFSERPPNDHAVKLLGFRSTSTSGFAGALSNWRRKALERIGHA